MRPEDKHGDDRNITVSELRAASTKTRVAPGSTSAAMRNVRKTLKVARRK
jgi:hypothetical protein